jgi:hypothetical protein
MENKISPSKNAIQYGVIFGAIMVLEFVITYIADIDPISTPSVGIVINLLNYLILPITLIYIACNSFKTKINFGFISFSQCLKSGVTVCLIAALISAVFSAIFIFIFPEFVDEIIDKTRQVMQKGNSNMTSEQIEVALSWTRKFMNPLITIPATIVMFSFIGLIYSLIIGAIVKKDNPQYN